MTNEEPIRKSICGFSAEFYGKLTDEQDATFPNVVISPFSIYTAMAMTVAGTGGKTKTETLGALGMPMLVWASKPHEQIGALVRKLITPTTDFVALMANRLFIIGSATVNNNFFRVLTDYYDSAFEVLSELPDNETRRTYINDWVSLSTRQKCTEILSKDVLLCEHTVKILSILCFKACWEPTFQIIQSTKFSFVGLDGVEKPCVPLYAIANVMHMFLTKYEAELVRIPFKEASWDMLILAPRENNGLIRLISRLRKPGELLNILNETPTIRPMHVYLPKFYLRQNFPFSVDKLLRKCGAQTLFDAAKADLSEMCTDVNLSVSDIVHRVTFEIEESIVCVNNAKTVEKSVADVNLTGSTICVQRPFFFAIVCDKNVPLLVGHVTTPAEQ